MNFVALGKGFKGGGVRMPPKFYIYIYIYSENGCLHGSGWGRYFQFKNYKIAFQTNLGGFARHQLT